MVEEEGCERDAKEANEIDHIRMNAFIHILDIGCRWLVEPHSH